MHSWAAALACCSCCRSPAGTPCMRDMQRSVRSRAARARLPALQKTVLHPLYKPADEYESTWDVAVLILDRAVNLTKNPPALLAPLNMRLPPGTPVWAAGWGQTQDADESVLLRCVPCPGLGAGWEGAGAAGGGTGAAALYCTQVASSCLQCALPTPAVPPAVQQGTAASGEQG